MPSDEHRAYVEDQITICRREVDRELHSIRERIESHTFTEEQVEAIATRAAEKAKVATKKELIEDVKLDIADGAISIMRTAAKAVGVFIVGLGFYVSTIDWSRFRPPWGN